MLYIALLLLSLLKRRKRERKKEKGEQKGCEVAGRKRPDCPANRDVACPVTVSPSSIGGEEEASRNKKKGQRDREMIRIINDR